MTQPNDEFLASIRLANPEQASLVSRGKLHQIKPGVSTLQDLYTSLGYPSAIRSFPSSVALRYPSEVENLPHILLLDRQSKTVQLVAICNHAETYPLANLEKQYGPPELADTVNSRAYWFFPDAGAAFIAEGRDKEDILYLQLLPTGLAMGIYQDARGYSQETFAFTSGEFKGLAQELAEGNSQTAICPVCGAVAERGCLYGADRNQLRWFAGNPSVVDNIASFFGGGKVIGQHDIWIGPYAEGIRCTQCRKIILDS